MVDLWLLQPGHKIRTNDGSEALVLGETQDGAWIRVRYLSVENDSTYGSEDLVHEDEVESLLGVVELEVWGKQVSVTLLLDRGNEEYPDTYQAITMSGVPYGVTVTGEDHESGERALDRLLSSLRVFGFSGHVNVHDVTKVGYSEQYDVQV